jgi:hypothetical protein
VTFGNSWDAGVTVPANSTVVSDPIPFNLIQGQDVFLTYWVPSGNPTVYRNGSASTSAWSISGNDQSSTIDWEGISITSTRSSVYVIEQMDVIDAGVDTAPTILTEPADQTVTEPASATFSVVAAGTSPVSYQWRRNGVDMPGEISASLTLTSTNIAESGDLFDVLVSNDFGSVVSRAAALTVLPTTGAPLVSWTAVDQNPGGNWSNSGWSDRSFRILIDGASITTGGSSVQITLRGRSSGSYTVQRVSLVHRESATLDGLDSSNQLVTFGGSWDDGATVAANAAITSDPISFDLVPGQDVFLTFWAPSGNPTVYRTGGADTSAWSISGDDQSSAIDWENLSISDTLAYIYIVETLEVLQ